MRLHGAKPAVVCGWVAAGALVFALTGCGSGVAYDTDPVSGRVTYDDGTLIPAERISVRFLPQAKPINAGTHPRAGQAEVDVSNGHFASAGTYDYDDGIVAGRHRVLVTAYDVENLPSDVIPAGYSDANQSPLEVDTADVPLHLKVGKP